MLHMILGGAGCGKSTHLMKEISHAADASVPLLTLVPEPYAFTYDKRLYGALGAKRFNQIQTGTFRSLTEELLRRATVAPQDAANDVVRFVILRQILNEFSKNRQLRFYSRQTNHPVFHAEMMQQLTELMQSGCTPEELLDAASHTEGSFREKLMDIAMVYAKYLDTLASRGLRDTKKDILLAAKVAEEHHPYAGYTIVMDEFESFTGDQYQLLEILLCDCAELSIALRTDNPDAPDYTRFDAVNQTARRLRSLAEKKGIAVQIERLETRYRYADASLAHLSKYYGAEGAPAYDGEPAITITQAHDVTLEAAYVAAEIRQLVMNHSLLYRDIMVVTHDLQDYGSLLEAAFRRYEIPYFMDLRKSVLHTAVMKLPLCLLALCHRITFDNMMLLLKTQLSPLYPTEAARLENYAYEWNIEGEQWEMPFATETDPSGQMESLRKRIVDPILRLRAASKNEDGSPVTGNVLCEALYRCMCEMDIHKAAVRLAKSLKEHTYFEREGGASGDGVQEGRAVRRLWERFTVLLDTLHDALAETPVTPEELSDLLTIVMRNDQIPLPPQQLNAVMVQNAAAARYDAPKVVFVLGVQEGKFPADIVTGGFFTEQERSVLAAQGVELARTVRDLCADERLIVYKTLSAPSEKLFLCYSLADESGKQLSPSSLLEEVRQMFPCLKNHDQYAERQGVEFYVTTKAAAYESFVQDYDISPTERETVRELLYRMPEEQPRLERLARSSDPARLRVHSQELMRKMTGKDIHVSATEFEDMVQCPLKCFCKHELKIYERKKREINALSVGNLVHECMEKLFLTYPEREGFLALSGDDLQALAEKWAEEFLERELGGRNGKSDRFFQQFHRYIDRITKLMLHTQQELRQSSFQPDAYELVIGQHGEEKGTEPYRLQIAEDRYLILNGKIDRVDIYRGEDGTLYLRVVDYKTGKTGKKEFQLEDIFVGVNLQMLLYLFALQEDGKKYPNAEAAGILYVPAGTPEYISRDTEKSPETIVNDYFKMKGMVLDDVEILRKMEKDVAGIYIPARLEEADETKLTKDSSVFQPKELQRIKKYVEDLIAEKTRLYVTGDVAPRPIKYGELFPCSYCPYKCICLLKVDKVTMKKIDKEEMQKILNGEEETNHAELDS